MLYLLGSFFGIKPIREIWRLSNGGLSNGPAILPNDFSLLNFSSTIKDKLLTEGRFSIRTQLLP